MPYGETWKRWCCFAGLQFTEINSSVLKPPGTVPPSNWGPELPSTPKFTKLPGCVFHWLSWSSHQSAMWRLLTRFNLWKNTLTPLFMHFLNNWLAFVIQGGKHMGPDNCLTVRSRVQWVSPLFGFLDSTSVCGFLVFSGATERDSNYIGCCIQKIQLPLRKINTTVALCEWFKWHDVILVSFTRKEYVASAEFTSVCMYTCFNLVYLIWTI